MFKPLLASPADLDTLPFPMIASAKIDGIRCIIDPALGPVTRTMKPIPNRHVRNVLTAFPVPLSYLDGELVTYSDGRIDDFSKVQSKIMSADGTPEFRFHVFDTFREPNVEYTYRMASLLTKFLHHPSDHVVVHDCAMIEDAEGLAAIESRFVDEEGWEGVMLRRPNGPYKFGRSTAREAILLKVKRFEDDEAIIVGAVELMHNGNEARSDAFGRTERSSNKANLVPMGTLGALCVAWRGTQFEIGTGFDAATRTDLWTARERIIGQSVTFKFQGVGPNGKPRFPVYRGLRFDLAA